MITFLTPTDTINWTLPQPVVMAQLVSKCHGCFDLPFSETQIGPVPEGIKDGIYKLLVDTECGCFKTQARVYLCHPPRIESTHTHTFPDADHISPECC